MYVVILPPSVDPGVGIHDVQVVRDVVAILKHVSLCSCRVNKRSTHSRTYEIAELNRCSSPIIFPLLLYIYVCRGSARNLAQGKQDHRRAQTHHHRL